jgi:hypothetical protein
MKLIAQIDRLYVKRGNRLFAIPKAQTLSDRIAAGSRPKGGWHKDNRVSGRARVIINAR